MAAIIQFPTRGPAIKAGATVESFEMLRRQQQSVEEAIDCTIQEFALAPFYGSVELDSPMLPFFAYAELSATGRTHCLLMPDEDRYFIDHPRDFQDPLWAAHLAVSVMTEAHWWGSGGNEPWRGLADPIGYVRHTILTICTRLKEGGCDTRVLANLPITLHTRRDATVPNVSRLELCFAAKRRIELVYSGSTGSHRAGERPGNFS
jgi:hypothetical protein